MNKDNFIKKITTTTLENHFERLKYLENMDHFQIEKERESLLDTISKIREINESDILSIRDIHYENDVCPKMMAGDGRYQHRATFIYENAIKPALDKNPKTRILNVGGGTGCLNFFFWIYKKGLRLENCTAVVDIVPQYLVVHSLYNIDTCLINLEYENLEDVINDKFDLIICSETIEHITKESQDRLINSSKMLLNPGGSLFLTYPSKKYFKYDSNPLGHKEPPDPEKIKKKSIWDV